MEEHQRNYWRNHEENLRELSVELRRTIRRNSEGIPRGYLKKKNHSGTPERVLAEPLKQVEFIEAIIIIYGNFEAIPCGTPLELPRNEIQRNCWRNTGGISAKKEFQEELWRNSREIVRETHKKLPEEFWMNSRKIFRGILGVTLGEFLLELRRISTA